MCYSPIKVKTHEKYKRYRGTLVHAYRNWDLVPCGKCYICKENKIEEWVIRWTEQLKDTTANSSYFVTLTYSDDKLPKIITPDGEEKSTLNYRDIQLFFKRLRKAQDKYTSLNNIPKTKIIYHGSGEYGTKNTLRPHYHILITNLLLPPENIENIWGNGLVHIGDNVNANSIKYVLKYQFKNTLENLQKKKMQDFKKVEVPIFMGETLVNTIVIYKDIETKFVYNCKGQKNEYRVAEKSFLSKGIGSNFVTPETIAQYHKNPNMHFLYFDADKQTYKVKPLPRYYRELIYNPKVKDENGKLKTDDYGRYIYKFAVGSPDFEGSPRYKRQLYAYKKQQQFLEQTLEKIKIFGLETILQQKREQKQRNYEKFVEARDKMQRLQNHRNKYELHALLI